MVKTKGYASVGVLGLVAVVVFGLMWSFAVLEDPGWIFGENMVSDLGVSYTRASMFFNLGCISGGILFALTGIRMAPLKVRPYAVSGGAVAVSGIFLIMIGLFPSDTGDLHNFFAIGLFVLCTLGMISMAVGDWMQRRVMLGGITMLMLVFVSVIYITRSLAYAEAVTILVFMAWIAMSAVKISFLKEKV